MVCPLPEVDELPSAVTMSTEAECIAEGKITNALTLHKGSGLMKS